MRSWPGAIVATAAHSIGRPSADGDTQLARDAAAGRGVPTFYGRDPADPAIPAFASAWALRYLRAHTDLLERSYPGLGHSLSMPEIADVVAFLAPLLRRAEPDRRAATS